MIASANVGRSPCRERGLKLRLQEAIERDVSDDGKIDNMMNRDKHVELIKKAVACLSDTLARIEKRSGAK